MTDATYFHATHEPKAKALQLPKPVPFAAPVFINDVASPLAGETVLSLLLRRLTKDE